MERGQCNGDIPTLAVTDEIDGVKPLGIHHGQRVSDVILQRRRSATRSDRPTPRLSNITQSTYSPAWRNERDHSGDSQTSSTLLASGGVYTTTWEPCPHLVYAMFPPPERA
jgi:hypothetical protein